MDLIEIPSFVTVLDFIGTFAFAISGIRLASAKRFDWFGAYIVGFATAVGGGTIRDLLLDVTPPWMIDPMYLVCTAFAMLFVILGIIGEYIAILFAELKDRPIYIVKDIMGGKDIC